MIKPEECNLYERTMGQIRYKAENQICAILQMFYHKEHNREVVIGPVRSRALFQLTEEAKQTLFSQFREAGWNVVKNDDSFYEFSTAQRDEQDA